MTIKTKLTLNVVIVLGVIGAVAVTSIIGMGFIKSKLFYLTERSTPFQMRTVEFQRAIQGTTADLVKLNASKDIEEYKTYRAEAEQSLSEVKGARRALETLSGGSKVETADELHTIAAELFAVAHRRLQAEEEAGAANKTITQKLKETSAKLKELDTKIKGLQLNRSAAFVTSLEDTKAISSRLRDIELLKIILKDLQLAVFEIQRALDKKALIIGRGKANSAISKALQNNHLRESNTLLADLKALGDTIEELVKIKSRERTADETRESALNKDIGEKLSSILLAIEQEVAAAGEKYGIETKKQGDVFTQANIATNILSGNSELLALGLSIEGLTTKLFTLGSSKDIGGVESDLRKVFEKVALTKKSLEKALTKIDAQEELKILRTVEAALTAVRGLLFAQGGVIAKIGNQLAMKEEAVRATGKLRAIVLHQAEQGKKTVTTAQGEQEKAIGAVNKMVRFSMLLIGAISIGAVVFGIAFGAWVYRSIAKPLNQLIKVSDEVASGDLKSEIAAHAHDEIGRVQTSMAAMVGNLRGIVGKIRVATESLAGSSEELAATATTLERGSREQTAQTEQSAAAMTEMSQTTLDVAKNASDTSSAAQKMKRTALQGREAMDTTVSELVRFAGTVRESAAKVESLGTKSEEINTIITLIKDIADQTNLLALNAAIEAARAGEQGRGFAVVADSVRQLAERTAHATDDIARTVKAMQAEVRESVVFMQKERESVENVIVQVKDTLGAIDGIVTYVEQVADMVQRIAAATEEQSSASEEVSHNMETIAGITRQLGSSIGEIKRTSEELSKFAVELNAMAGWFKV
jgi:methyl-accepting chemotaxis protein